MKRLLLLVVFTSYLYFYFHASFFVRYSRGVQPLTLRNVALKRLIVLNPHEKAMQRALIQYRNPKNYELVMEALKVADFFDSALLDDL